MYPCRSFFTIMIILVSHLERGACLQADDIEISQEAMIAVIRRSIPPLEKGMAGSADQRQCFTCHHQAIPVLVLTEARKRGFSIDGHQFERQIRHTLDHLIRGREDYLAGRGQGGKVLSAGYALWTLAVSGWMRDDTTDAVVKFLLEYQKDSDHWSHRGHRPPSSGSDFTATYVALRGLQEFGNEQQQAAIEIRTEQVKKWLLSEAPQNTEDHVFRLWALRSVGAGEQIVQKATSALIGLQREDGGWAQTAGRDSDPYATGTVLVALFRVAEVEKTHPCVRHAVRYLVNCQLEDGTWHVVTRAKPFQAYFESGFPHGKDQFISIAASSWATLALIHMCPEKNLTE